MNIAIAVFTCLIVASWLTEIETGKPKKRKP